MKQERIFYYSSKDFSEKSGCFLAKDKKGNSFLYTACIIVDCKDQYSYHDKRENYRGCLQDLTIVWLNSKKRTQENLDRRSVIFLGANIESLKCLKQAGDCSPLNLIFDEDGQSFFHKISVLSSAKATDNLPFVEQEIKNQKSPCP